MKQSMMKVRSRSRLDSREPEQSTIIEQPSASELILSASFTNQLESNKGASFTFEEKERTYAEASVQCDNDANFEILDSRKCLRCGLNDKSSSGVCLFHPAKPKLTGGSGDLLYSSEWHLCREKCKSIASDYQPMGCKTNKSHFYGSNIPFKPRSKSRSRSPKAETSRQRKENTARVDKQSMTDISLMYNPFKSESTEIKTTPQKKAKVMISTD